MTLLIIARHGNTFEPHEIPRRVGARTDLPLVEKGREQAAALGRYLRENGMLPEAVYASQLKRAVETAELALAAAKFKLPVRQTDIFNEIDYGIDENRPEEEVKARLGEQALKDWDEKGVVPPGWEADPAALIRNWRDFAVHIVGEHPQGTVLVVTSNGVARFAPQLAAFDAYPKLSTGALGILHYEDDGAGWNLEGWNIRPGA